MRLKRRKLLVGACVFVTVGINPLANKINPPFDRLCKKLSYPQFLPARSRIEFVSLMSTACDVGSE
jgi:hypothetical protein